MAAVRNAQRLASLQPFFEWHATEDRDEPRPNPVAGLRPPKVNDKLMPVFTGDELAAILATCKGGGFQNRRDYAVMSLFKDSGVRLSEAPERFFPSGAQKPTDAIDPVASHLFADPRLAASR